MPGRQLVSELCLTLPRCKISVHVVSIGDTDGKLYRNILLGMSSSTPCGSLTVGDMNFKFRILWLLSLNSTELAPECVTSPQSALGQIGQRGHPIWISECAGPNVIQPHKATSLPPLRHRSLSSISRSSQRTPSDTAPPPGDLFSCEELHLLTWGGGGGCHQPAAPRQATHPQVQHFCPKWRL